MTANAPFVAHVADADERLSHLRAGAQAEPTSAAARAALAAGLLREGVASARAKDKSRARTLLRELAALTPEDDRVWMWLASVADGYREARACLTQVLSRCPEHAPARDALARLDARATGRRDAPVTSPQTGVFAVPDAAPEGRPPEPAPQVPAAAAGLAPPVAGAPPVPAATRATPAGPPPAPVPPAPPPAGIVPDRPARSPVMGFSPASTLFRTEVDVEPAGTARPGSVLHLFEHAPASGLPADAPPADPRPQKSTVHPIGFRPPFAEPSAARDRTQAASSRHGAERLPSRGVVLVVDDSPAVLKGLEFELEGHRVEVLTASSGPEALQRLLTVTPDLVLLDADMPLMDGYQVCRAIHGEDRTHRVPVVILATGGGIAERVRCRLAGAAGFLLKPLDAAALTDALDRHLPVRF
jgi:CheY-like chemotaxis protein